MNVRLPRYVLVVAVAASTFMNARLQAHEIGTTRVSADLSHEGVYRIEVVTDARALVTKLETSAGSTADPSDSDAASLQQRLSLRKEDFLRRVTVTFDGAAVRPSVNFEVMDSSDVTAPPRATITIFGQAPKDASEFGWSYGWTFATYSLTVTSVGKISTQWLEGEQSSMPIVLAAPPLATTRLEVASRYFVLGFTHIVPHGLDHMLFVLGIFLLSRKPREVLLQVSAFTIAHSITLALSIYGILSVSARVVEPLIAVSIAYVAIENLVLSDLKPWRVALVFAFGLLHGMGFAGVLRDLGLPRSEFITALITFNVGVEAGQLAVIGGAFLLVVWYCGRRPWYRWRVVVPASALIACTAVFWTVERLFS